MKAFPKWQRIRYSPATTLGEDGRRVTASDKHIALSREAACEGMVLLKNDENLLPFAKGTKLALFGKGTVDYVKGGGGSGDVTVSYTRCLLKGLCIKQDEGKVELFAPLNDYYTAYMQEQYAQGQEPGRCPEAAVPAELLEQARAFTDTAVITLCRFSGEGWDRTGKPYDGDFYLSHEEEAMVQAVQAAFPRIAVVLNTGGMMDTVWFKDNSKIQSALLAWQAGIEGGLATADILCGDVCPSGRLTDTFAVNFAAYPSSDTFNESEDYVTYNEDIFVGYRYFETIPGAAEKVCYPFGYGLSYTSFEITGA
ncbi:MAG: glycoside hydrolase family 3 C-terminal domain-containing protein, partial [Clostridia bacterium]|nr:glycoside hydrolase family 3 C-terminal domain-containing protein [Clostridia bacterium]